MCRLLVCVQKSKQEDHKGKHELDFIRLESHPPTHPLTHPPTHPLST